MSSTFFAGQRRPAATSQGTTQANRDRRRDPPAHAHEGPRTRAGAGAGHTHHTEHIKPGILRWVTAGLPIAARGSWTLTGHTITAEAERSPPEPPRSPKPPERTTTPSRRERTGNRRSPPPAHHGGSQSARAPERGAADRDDHSKSTGGDRDDRLAAVDHSPCFCGPSTITAPRSGGAANPCALAGVSVPPW